MTTSKLDTHRRRQARVLVGGLAVTAVLSALLAGCSGSDDLNSAQGAPAAQGYAGDAGSVAAADSASADEAASVSEEPSDADGRQVIQTGDVSMRTKDALVAAASVVTHVEGVGGRVDDRSEQAGSDGARASATLVVRVPAEKVTSTIDTLRGLGTVDSVDLKATDVTGAAQDLDARIHSLELSIARMDDLLAKATTSRAIIDAESALTERQSNLEQLQAERARLADQVSLSTLTVAIYGPDVPPPVPADGPGSFLDGLAVGWDAFVSSVRSVVIVAGVLLPWVAFAGALVAGWIAARRWRRRSSRAAGAAATPAPLETAISPAPEAPTP